MSERLSADLKAEARAAGFALARITPPDRVGHVGERLRDFLDNGRHGSMDWMERRIEWRSDPRSLWPEVRSILMCAELYTPEVDPLATLKEPDLGTISVYARGRDYHDVVKKRLKRVARWLVAESGAEVKVFVDTAPVPEKALGQAAGLGWQGKHTNLLSRDAGNWFFLGAIFTTATLVPDEAETDHCGSCRACLDICPTGAFPAPYQLDARRCISYLTIEHKGPVDLELRERLGNRIYGCDDCLAVCPWNKFAQAGRDARLAPRGDLDAPDLADLAALDETGFRAKFAGSPIKRTGHKRMLRNVLYAIGNSGKSSLRASAARHCEADDPVVRDAARWAVTRL